MELYLGSLILEVTRRCNMACEHCLRGDAQQIDMTTEVVDRVLDAVQGNGIGTVTFTGGEPSLNVPIIQYFVDRVKSRGIGVGSFFVVTNGKKESMGLVHALIDLYAHCDEKEMCTLVVSSDGYHEVTGRSEIYPALRFFNPEGHGPRSAEAIRNEGRAAENGIGRLDVPASEWEVEAYDEEYVSVGSDLHVSANGNVINGCDFSFERVDRDKVGNVLQEPLQSIIQRVLSAQEALCS